MKVSLEFELIPAIGVLVGYEKEAGIVIMLPFVCINIKREKKTKGFEITTVDKH